MSNGVQVVENAIEQAHQIAPWVEGILPMIPTIGVPAAAVVKILDGLEPALLNALSILSQANSGNILTAAVELANHLTPGMPSSPHLGKEATALPMPTPASPDAVAAAKQTE